MEVPRNKRPPVLSTVIRRRASTPGVNNATQPRNKPQESLVAFFKSQKMTSKERDLVSQADQILGNLLGEKLNEAERQALEKWLSGKIEEERKGWKQKLQMSMKEIEKERKVALESQIALQNMNNKIETMFSPTLTLYREQSMYYPDDKDVKATSLTELDKNLSTIQDVINNFSSEREEICDHFHIPEDNAILDYLRNLSAEQEEKLKSVNREAQETEERLRREIRTLNDTFELRENISKVEKDGFNAEIAAKKQEISDLHEIIHRQKLRLKTDSSVPREDKCVQALLLPRQRECCIQVDIPPPSSVDSGISEDEGQGHFSPPRLKPLGKPKISVDLTAANYRKKRTGKEQKTPRSTSTDPHIGSTSNASNNSTKSRLISMSQDALLNGHDPKPNASGENQAYSILHVRNHVVTLAQKLEKAKWDTEEYERKLALLKFQTNSSPTNEYNSRKPQSNKALNSIEANRKWASSEGFLAGTGSKPSKPGKIKFDLDDPKHRKSKGRTPREPEESNGSSSGSSSVSMRCLRCDKTYSSKENSKVACRYHPKSKQKIEKYDTSGKLLKVIIIWECCMQGEGAVGCSVGEHI